MSVRTKPVKLANGWNLGSALRGRSAVAIVAALPLVLALVLLMLIVESAFRPASLTGPYTLDNLQALYGNPHAMEAMINTLVFSLVTVCVALFFAVPIAWLVERTDLPGRSAVFPMMTASILIPGFFSAMGWYFLLHPRIGIVNQWLSSALSLDHSPIAITNLIGMGWVQGVSLSSLAFIMLAGSFRSIDPALEESAAIHGMRPLSRFRKITIPLVWPAILSSGLYVFAIALASFDVPAIIGLGNRIYTFSTFALSQLNPERGPPNYGIVGASSLLLIAVALLLSWWYLRVIRAAHRYAVVGGKGYRQSQVRLGRWAIVGWTFIGIKVAMSVLMPGFLLLWASLLPYFQAPSGAAIESLTLANYREIPWTAFTTAAKNTAFLVVIVPTITLLLGLAISWIVIRSKMRFAWLYDLFAFLPHAVPDIMFALGILILALFWIPKFIPFWGTIWIIVAVYVVTRIAFATRVYNSALIQIHRELDEAGYVFGLKVVQVLRHILWPLLTPVLLYTWIWMALLTFRELTMAVFLVTRGNNTMPALIFALWSGGQQAEAAAIGVIMLLAVTPLVALYFVVGRRRMPMVG